MRRRYAIVKIISNSDGIKYHEIVSIFGLTIMQFLVSIYYLSYCTFTIILTIKYYFTLLFIKTFNILEFKKSNVATESTYSIFSCQLIQLRL